MRSSIRKIITAMLTCSLALSLVAGGIELVGMLGGPSVSVQVLGSDGDYVPPSRPHKSKPSLKSNSMTAKGKTISLSAVTLSKKSRKLSRKNVISIKKSKGTLRFRKRSGNKKLKVNYKTGRITVKKGLGAGTYKLKVAVKDYGNSRYKSKTSVATVKIKVLKAANTLSVSGRSVTVDGAVLAEADQIIACKDAISVKKAQGPLTYEKVSGSKYLTVDYDTGGIKVKKGLPDGIYTICVSVKAEGNKLYKSSRKNADVKVTVQTADDSGEEP